MSVGAAFTAGLVLGYGLWVAVFELLFWWHEHARPALNRLDAKYEAQREQDIAQWGGSR